MKLAQPLGIAGAGAMFVLAVVAMLPPTERNGAWSSIHYPTPVPVVFRASSDGYQAQPSFYYGAAPAEETAPPVDTTDRDEAVDAATAREIAIAEDDRAYGDGYAWASDRGVASPRACLRLRRSERDGCRDYVASLAAEDDGDLPR